MKIQTFVICILECVWVLQALAFPSVICGITKSILFLRNAIFFLMAGFSYIALCIANDTIMGILAPNPTVNTVDIGVSSIPFASLPMCVGS